MKIYIASCLSEGCSEENQENILRSLWQKSDKSHDLLESIHDADIALFCNIAGPGWFADLRRNPLILRFPKKCFAISDSDRPLPLLHGIYTSAHKGLKFQDRFRSAAYNLYPKNYRNPLIEVCRGNDYVNLKEYLVSFIGRDSAPVRKQLFQLPFSTDCFVANSTDKFNLFGQALADQANWEKRYFEVLSQSKFAVCPRGVGAASVRLFEAMRMGVAPIILSDEWIFPKGPDWGEFALIVPEKDVDKLYQIAKLHEGRALDMGRKARLAYEKYFADEVYFNYLVDQMVDILQNQKIPERVFWSCRNLVVTWWKLRKKHLMME